MCRSRGFDDHPDTKRVDRLSYGLSDLAREALLHLQAAREHVRDAGELAQPDHLLDMHKKTKWLVSGMSSINSGLDILYTGIYQTRLPLGGLVGLKFRGCGKLKRLQKEERRHSGLVQGVHTVVSRAQAYKWC